MIVHEEPLVLILVILKSLWKRIPFVLRFRTNETTGPIGVMYDLI